MTRITMTQFRAQPGEYLLNVIRDGAEYMLCKQGKDVARLLPTSEDIVIDGAGKRVAGPALEPRRCRYCRSTEHFGNRCPQNPWNAREHDRTKGRG